MKNLCKFLIGLMGLLGLAGSAYGTALAQSPSAELIMTWRAESYAPAWYQGKILPTARSPIVVSAAALDSGVLGDVSNETVYWYLKNQLVAKGSGLDTVVLRAPDASGGIIRVRAEIPGLNLVRTLEIPVVPPRAVIRSVYPGGITGSRNISLAALPFFFNIQSVSALNFAWLVNGRVANDSGDPKNLNIALGADTQANAALNVNLNISNPADGSSASANSVFTYQP